MFVERPAILVMQWFRAGERTSWIGTSRHRFPRSRSPATHGGLAGLSATSPLLSVFIAIGMPPDIGLGMTELADQASGISNISGWRALACQSCTKIFIPYGATGFFSSR